MYRVRFRLRFGPDYYSEFFDTLTEAKTFVRNAESTDGVLVYRIEDKNGEVI